MKPLDIKELQNRLDAISEAQVNEYKITTRDGMEFDQEAFNLAHATYILAQKLVAKAGQSKNRRYDPEAEFYAASDYYGYPDLEELGMPMYYDLAGSDKREFLKNYQEPPVVNPDAIGESVQEGEAEQREQVEEVEQPVAEEDSVEEAIEDGKTYAWINVVTGDHGYGTKEESSNWTHYIPMSDFSYFSGDEDYKGLDDETAQEEGWIAVKEEEVHEGDAELAELKSALGRTGGVMGFSA